MNFLKNISELENFPISLHCSSPEVIEDSLAMLNSKFISFSKKYSEEIKESTASMKKPNFSQIVIDVYKLEDFENKFIKFSSLSFIAGQALAMKSLERDLPIQ